MSRRFDKNPGDSVIGNWWTQAITVINEARSHREWGVKQNETHFQADFISF